jgi:Na+/melibiose symporter-like transporter
VVGAISDRTWLDAESQRRRWWCRWLPAGRRRPWTAVAAVLVAVALLFMGLAGNPVRAACVHVSLFSWF